MQKFACIIDSELLLYTFPVFLAGGQAKTLMFVQINPDVESFSETISTLKFAERVSGVELGAARSSKEGKDVRELMEQVIFYFSFFYFCFFCRSNSFSAMSLNS